MNCRAVTPQPIVLACTQATVRLGRRILGPFSLTVRAGERIAILGPSGAGKSTLLRLVARELPPIQGDLVLHERPLQDWSLSELSRRRAVLPQAHDVAFGLPAHLVVALGRVARAHDARQEDVVRQAAELACAAHVLGQRFDTLSGGEQARIQLARVFAQLWDEERALLLVDEPLAALDPGLQFQLLDAIDQFAAQRGHAVLAVLHDINHALMGFERLWLLKAGEVVGDIPASTQAVAPLASLYGIGLACAIAEQGQTVVIPVRAQAAQACAV